MTLDPKISRLAYSAALAAVAFSLLLVVGKAWAWMQSDSTALLSSLIDSLVDSIISFTNFLALRYALQPADEDHRYGHGKAEGIAALGQAAFIAGSCAFIVLEAIRRLSDASPVQAVDLGIYVLIAATLGTLVLTRYQKWVAHKTKSLAVEADSTHYGSDMVVNIGVIASLYIGQQTGWIWLDPVVALIVAAWLLYNASGIGLKAINMLLDREIEDSVRIAIRREITQTDGVLAMHDLRTRRSGPNLMVSFDIEVDPTLSVAAAHEISRKVEERVLTFAAAHAPYTEVMIHIDPLGDTTDSRHKKLRDFHAH